MTATGNAEPLANKYKIERKEMSSITKLRASGSMLLTVGFLAIGFSVILFVLRNDLVNLIIPVYTDLNSELLHNRYQSFIALTSAFIGLVGGGQVLLYYLRYGTVRLKSIKVGPVELRDSERFSSLEYLDDRVESLEEMQAYFEETLEELKITSTKMGELNEEQRLEVTNIIKSKIIGDLAEEFVADLENKYSQDAVKATRIRELRQQQQKTSARLGLELDALTRRANVNLVIGSLTTVLGLAILGYMVFSGILTVPFKPEESTTKAAWTIAVAYLPRLSLVVFIQIFAFFFLKMYKTNLEEIKYFQNELTNAESKFIALETAVLSGDTDSVRNTIKVLSKTERNFVLSKGQSTVELEKARMETNTMRELVHGLFGKKLEKIKKG